MVAVKIFNKTDTFECENCLKDRPIERLVTMPSGERLCSHCATRRIFRFKRIVNFHNDKRPVVIF